jgi:hypothetical protein
LINLIISPRYQFMLDPTLTIDTSEAIRSIREKLVDTQQQIISSGDDDSGGGVKSSDVSGSEKKDK